MKIFIVLVQAALFTLAVILLAIPETRSQTTRIILFALVAIDGVHAAWGLHKSGLLMNTTPSGLNQAYRVRPEIMPRGGLLSAAATIVGLVATVVSSS